MQDCNAIRVLTQRQAADISRDFLGAYNQFMDGVLGRSETGEAGLWYLAMGPVAGRHGIYLPLRTLTVRFEIGEARKAELDMAGAALYKMRNARDPRALWLRRRWVRGEILANYKTLAPDMPKERV